jgi:hypothetical protein
VTTCKPRYRLDLYRSGEPLTVLVYEKCGMLRIGERYARYTEEVRGVLESFLRGSVRRPTHRVVRLQVPVQIEPRKALRAIRPFASRVYLPGLPFGREPYVKVSTRLREPLPADLTQLDRRADELRREAVDLLKRYAQGLVDSRPEVKRFDGPYPLEESFGRDMRVRYGVTILFEVGTDALTMRYHCSHLEFHIDEAVVPDYYRMDAVFPKDKKLSEVREVLKKISFERAGQAREASEDGEDAEKKDKLRISLWKGART